MRLGGEMQDRVGREALQPLGDQLAVEDIGAAEMIARVAGDRVQRFRVGGVGQLIDIEDCGAELADKQPAHRRADKTGAAGNQDFHRRRFSAPGRPGSILVPFGTAKSIASAGSLNSVRLQRLLRMMEPCRSPHFGLCRSRRSRLLASLTPGFRRGNDLRRDRRLRATPTTVSFSDDFWRTVAQVAAADGNRPECPCRQSAPRIGDAFRPSCAGCGVRP